jgi:hypothetical protein
MTGQLQRLFSHVHYSPVIIVWLLAGCSYLHPVTFENAMPRGDTVSVGTMNRKLAGRSATIFRRDGKEVEARNVFLTRDSCLFTDSSGRAFLPTMDVLAIRNVDRFSSAVGGFGLGLVGGFAVGMGTAFLIIDLHDAASRMGAGLLALGITVAGSLVGLVVGAAHGTITDYLMPGSDSTSTHTR